MLSLIYCCGSRCQGKQRMVYRPLFFRCFFLPAAMPQQLLKPNAQRKTELNSTELFRSVQFPAVYWTCDDPRRFGDEIGGRRRFFTIEADSRESANQCNVCRWTTTGDELRRLATAVSPGLDCQEPATVGAARRRFNAQRKTELNSTERSSSVQLSWVEFSFPLCIGLKVNYYHHHYRATQRLLQSAVRYQRSTNIMQYPYVTIDSHGHTPKRRKFD